MDNEDRTDGFPVDQSHLCLGHLAGNRSGKKEARDMQDLLASKFLSDSLAPWQFRMALCTK
jgi:hypothetical protein